MKRKILNKYNNMSMALKAAIWFAGCHFLQKGISMLTTPFFTRLLSTSEYGRTSAFFSWADILMPLFTLSVWRGMMNLFAKDYNKDRVLSSVVSLSMIISLAFGCFIVLTSEFYCEIMAITKPLLIGLLIYCFSQNIFLAWTVRMQYEYRYKELVIVTLAYSVIPSVCGVIWIIFYSRVAEGKLLPQVICLMLIAFGIYIYSIKKDKTFFDKEIWLFCISFSVPLIPHYLSEVILQSSDRAMINSMCGTSDVAIYSIAYSVGNLIYIIAGAVNSAFVPFQYQKIKEKDYSDLAHKTTIIVGFIAFCLCGLMLFGREIVIIFGGEKYQESVKIIIPICLGVFFNFLFQLFARIQEYYEQKYTIVVASVSCAILNIGLNYIFINIFGYQAAAYTTFLCYFVFCFLHYIFYRRVCKKHIGLQIYDIKALLIISIMLILLAVIIASITELYLAKYTTLLIIILLMIVFRKKIIDFIWKMKG